MATEISAPVHTLLLESSAFQSSAYDPYGNNTIPVDNYRLEKDINYETTSGFQAKIYINDTDKKIYFANTGTNGGKDVASWIDAYTGAGSSQYSDMLKEANEINKKVQLGGEYAGYTIISTGNSWGELMAQVQSYVFGWTGVGYDGPGGGQIVSDPRFEALLADRNITAVKGSSFISINVNGWGPFGAGMVGFTGVDIPNVRHGSVTVADSISSGIANVLFAIVASNPLVGALVGKGLFGAAVHVDSESIATAIQNGDVELNNDSGATTRALKQFVVRDPKTGNQITIKTNPDGSLATDADGNPIYEITRYVEGEEVKEIYNYKGVSLNEPSGLETFVKGVNTYSPAITDALSIVQAVQNGQPLPALSSTLSLANNLNKLQGITDYELGLTSNVASGVVSLLSLNNAIEQGDNLAIASSSLQLVSYGAQAYANFALSNGAALTDAAVQNAQGISSTISQEVLPALNVIRAIDSGDNEAIAVAVISYAVPVVGQIYAVYNLVSSIFADGPPDPWGTGQYVWGGRNASGGSALSVSSAGESGGSEAVQGVMDAVVATLNSIIERERVQNPGAQLGLIPERMPTLGYGLSGFSYTNIDPLTGVEKNPGLRFDTSGNPINAEPGSPESFQSLIEGMVRSALSRGAIAPLWEVETASRQSDAGDPKAGLTEEARAGRDGQLAAVLTGATQSFRPVSLDLDGDGIETIIKENSNVYFDVDDSGYKKKTAWIGADDALLTIDRNYNGNLDSGRELFSNGKVALGRRGLAGMGWVDSNYDGKITSADPVWNEINVWQDANSNGVQDDGESHSLSDLGITELNYSLGTFTQNGVVKQLGSPDLIADTEGTRTTVVEEGIIIESSNGNISLLVSRVDDKTLLEPNRDGITGFEDIEIIVSGKMGMVYSHYSELLNFDVDYDVAC